MTVSPGTDVAVTELLATLAGLPGLLRACVFEVETGTVCMTVGSDVEPPASLLARARQAHARSDGGTDVDDDVIVTSSGAHHLLREVPAAAGDVLRTAVLWVYVELDGERADLSLARRRLAHATRHDGAPAPPSLTFTSSEAAPPPPVATPALAMLPPLDESWGPIGAAGRAAKTRRAPAVAAPVVPTRAIPPQAAPVVPPPRVVAVPPPPAPPVPSPAPPSPAPPSPIPSPIAAPVPPPSEPAPVAPPVEQAPDPAPAAPPVERAPDDPPSAPLPRRVPVMGRPLSLIEPPTVPPPPPPGASPEPDDTTTETAVPAPPDEPEEPDEPGEPGEPDGDAPTTEVAATTTHPMPTRRHAPSTPSLPAPRSPERPGGWDTDAGTLRRLMVTLRRLA